MLKWTVNGPRQSYLQVEDKINSESADQSHFCALNIAHRERRKLKRKSSDCYAVECKSLFGDKDKENHMTSSTPLHSSTRCASSNNSPLRKLDSLKDLSNIVPENSFGTPKTHPRTELKNLPKTPDTCLRLKSQNLHKTTKVHVQDRNSIPTHYASTLPTYDVEYSPCGLIPGQMLALRGVGIADRYFEKPRYLTEHFNDLNAQCASKRRTERNDGRQSERPPKSAFHEEDSSLSSSRMGDTTLDRMIDAILESTRKERKLPKNLKQNFGLTINMSPTYTPADDPASDLHEFWDTKSEKYQQEDTERTFCHSTIKKMPFNEREVRATVVKKFKKENLFQLRRQRAVRRKRKISTKIGSSVKSSAQKLLMIGGSTGQPTTNSLHKNCAIKTAESASKNELLCEEPHQSKNDKSLNNISPDSGRNSSSDLEDSTLEQSNSELVEGNENKSSCKGLDVTKRRLSFSTNNVDSI